MKILWMTWKDRQHPLAGGAEVVNEELAKRLVADGHEVVFLVGGFAGKGSNERVEGRFEPNSTLNPNTYTLIRLGNRFTVYWKAYRYYKQHLQGWADLVIDEVNTIPFMAKFYVKEPNILFVHMLCRQIWFYEMVFPLSLLGYLIEPVYLWLLRDREVVTVSNSTKQDLMKFGFKEKNLSIISEGIELEPLKALDENLKYPEPTLLSLGSIRPMKRTLDQLKAFELAKAHIPTLKLKIAGDSNSKYGHKVLKLANASRYKDDIEYLGKVSGLQKLQLLQKCHLIMVTSVKEGWGLIVTEANSQGTPTVAYNVDGLRDSIKDNCTGLICKNNTPANLAQDIIALINNQPWYKQLQTLAHKWSREINFDRSYREFKQLIS